MFVIGGSFRRVTFKLQRRVQFYVKLFIFLAICVYVFDGLNTGNRLFRRRKIVVQKDLLNYNEDGLRPDWPFGITKHYDAYDLRTYVSKPKIISKFDLPGERGDWK